MPPSIYARSITTICLAELGEFAEAERSATEAATLTRTHDLPSGFVLARMALGHVALVQGRIEDAMQIHVLDLFGGEVGQRVERLPPVDLEVAREGEHLGRDELFHEAEQVRVGAHLDVAELDLLGRRQARDAAGPGQSRRQPGTK